MMHSNTANSRSGRVMSERQKEHDLNEDVVKQKRITTGCNVRVEHGIGKVVSRDLPYRVIVEVTNPLEQYKGMVSRFTKSRLCYMPKEVEVI